MEAPCCGQEHDDLHQCDRAGRQRNCRRNTQQGYKEDDDQHAIQQRRGGMTRESFANGAIARQPHQQVTAAALLKEAIWQRQQVLEESSHEVRVDLPLQSYKQCRANIRNTAGGKRHHHGAYTQKIDRTRSSNRQHVINYPPGKQGQRECEGLKQQRRRQDLTEHTWGPLGSPDAPDTVQRETLSLRGTQVKIRPGLKLQSNAAKSILEIGLRQLTPPPSRIHN